MSDSSDDLMSPLREHPVLGVEARDGAVVIRLAGEIDLYNVEDVRTALTEAIESEPRRVVIDLTAVEFVDSTALGSVHDRGAVAAPARMRCSSPPLNSRRAGRCRSAVSTGDTVAGSVTRSTGNCSRGNAAEFRPLVLEALLD